MKKQYKKIVKWNFKNFREQIIVIGMFELLCAVILLSLAFDTLKTTFIIFTLIVMITLAMLLVPDRKVSYKLIKNK